MIIRYTSPLFTTQNTQYLLHILDDPWCSTELYKGQPKNGAPAFHIFQIEL